MIEADRIAEKYVLTLDQGLTETVLEDMLAKGLDPFLPRRIIREAYDGNAKQGSLSPVTDLLSELQAVL